MDVALCYPSVLPGRGGCETYITDLARRLARDGHGVHLYASVWDAAALPASTHVHRIEPVKGPRWLRPWRFAAACESALRRDKPGVSLGFDKTWGQDFLYPQGGLHAATIEHNFLKHATRFGRGLARVFKSVDLANWSYARLERQQYFREPRPGVIVNSEMVARHFEEYYEVPRENLRVIRSAIDPARFVAEDRFTRRHEERARWGVPPDAPVGLFAAMNYRLKGLEPLLNALPPGAHLVVIGHPNVSRYQRIAANRGIADRVRFLGHRSDPRDAYFAADYLVHPTFYDPCSLVVLEALACGLPVITTQYNGAAELLNEQSGIVIQNPHDREELAAAITRMGDPTFRAAAGPAVRAAASAWTFDHHYRALLALLQERAQLRRAA